MNGLLLGFLVGFLIYPWFGPVGVLLGGVLGFLADMMGRRVEGPGGQMGDLVQRLVTLWGLVAGHGQTIGPVQILFLQGVLSNQLHLRPGDAAQALEIFRRQGALAAGQPWSALFEEVRSISSEIVADFFLDEQTLLWAYATTRRLAALGVVRPGLVELLDVIARGFGIFEHVGTAGVEGSRASDERAYDDAWSRFRPASSAGPEAYQTLGLTPDASVDQIKKAYRALVRQFHPDAHSHLDDASPDKKRAAERFLQVQQAYERIRQARAF